MKDRRTKASFVISNFSSLEEQLLACLTFLPYTPDNHHVVSPRFVPIILDACSLIDSVLRDFVHQPEERTTFKQYARETEEYLKLDTAFSILLSTKLAFLNPFSSWKAKTPVWWSAYNRLKHDRLNNYAEATYETTVLALCALHQVIARNRNWIPSLISAGWFNSDDSHFEDLIGAQHIGEGVTPINVMAVESKLFVTPLHSNFVEFSDRQPVVSEDCEFSPRVAAMIWAFEWYGPS